VSLILLAVLLVPGLLSSCGGPGVQQALHDSWSGYKRQFIQGGGRVVDPQRGDLTTSEGQSYALLRAVWMDDRSTFDKVWKWTRTNLQVRGDHLFAYLWGPSENGRSEALSQDSAADADEDVALALLFANRHWQDQSYLDAARPLLGDIWNNEVGFVGGSPYIAAGDWATRYQVGGLVVNPSYFAPAAYRVFQSADPSHPWSWLASTSYQALAACSRSPLGAQRSVGLPPNWCVLDVMGVHSYWDKWGGDAYGYDAFRSMWRIALDQQWFQSPQARSYLESTSFLRRQWRSNDRLAAAYTHDGHEDPAGEDPTTYGGNIGNFVVVDPSAADTILHEKLLSTLHEWKGIKYFGDRSNYFEQNWVWFGIALAGQQLPDLAS
jgi:endoglucanase